MIGVGSVDGGVASGASAAGAGKAETGAAVAGASLVMEGSCWTSTLVELSGMIITLSEFERWSQPLSLSMKPPPSEDGPLSMMICAGSAGLLGEELAALGGT